jgi:hypothetical protein
MTSFEGLRYVEAETSRLCNRTCSWCPNGQSGRRREQQLMPWTMFAGIAGELGSAGFSGFFALHNYNEPLANPRLIRELELIGAAVPDARPAIYTNGDLLKRELLERLLKSGVRYVRVTRYPHRADEVPDFEPLKRWMRSAGLLSMTSSWEWGPVRQGLAARWLHGGTLIEVIRPAVTGYNDRGGTAVVPDSPRARQAPCLVTATSLSVDYRGVVKMCCNVIPDSAPDHEQYAVGSVADSTLADLWGHDRMREWRKRHAMADWSASPACRTCVQVLPETRQ